MCKPLTFMYGRSWVVVILVVFTLGANGCSAAQEVDLEYSFDEYAALIRSQEINPDQFSGALYDMYPNQMRRHLQYFVNGVMVRSVSMKPDGTLVHESRLSGSGFIESLVLDDKSFPSKAIGYLQKKGKTIVLYNIDILLQAEGVRIVDVKDVKD